MAGLVTDGAGNIYVADKSDQTIRKVTPSGVVTTFAGISGVAGATDGSVATATFNQPMSLAFDPGGNLLVVDAGSNTIRRISSQGVVSTVAGKPGTAGAQDGVGPDARFDFCRDTDLPISDPDIVVDKAGNAYLTSCEPTIRRITPDGTVSTLVKNDEIDPTAPILLVSPQGLAIGPDQTLYVCDEGTVKRVTLDGQVSVLGPVQNSHGGPGIAVDANGTVYTAEAQLLYATDAAGNRTTIAPMPWGGSVDGPVAQAQFNRISGLAIGPDGTLYLADTGNYSLRTLSNGVVSTLAGQALFNTAVDGQGANAGFGFPFGIAIGGDGAVYVADQDANAIRRVTLDGQVSTLAGELGIVSANSVDGDGAAASFDGPEALTLAPDGGLYTVDVLAGAIRHVTLLGSVTTLPVTAYPYGGSGPWFTGVAVREDGSLALTDQRLDVVMTMPGAGGAMTTLAGLPFKEGSVDGDATTARFDAPTGAVADKSGNLYVSDDVGCTLRKVDAQGNVTTLAGTAGQCGFADGVGAQARFNSPRGMAIDPATGNLYVADTYNQVIRKVTQDGVVTTVVGRAGCQGFVTGALPGCISWPQAVALDGHALYITTSRGVAVARGVP
jgi:sugar lactone lactonase YvrE